MTNTKDEHILALGGGLASVSAAYWLAKHKIRVTIVEKEPDVGGLAKSKTYHSKHGDFSYDIGPHRFHSTDNRVTEETLRVLGENVVHRARLSRILLYNQFFDYPLKLGRALVQLPKPVMAVAIWDYFRQAIKNLFVTGKDDNFEAWVVKRFGWKLYRVFFGVYTQKTWGVPCTQISADWASQRIAQASLWDAIKKSLFRPKGNIRQLSTDFHYPKVGGVGGIARSFARAAKEMGTDVRCNTTVEALLVENGRCIGARVVDKDGRREVIKADRILNTMPVNKVIDWIEPKPPQAVIDHAHAMKYRSMVFVYLILNRPQLTPDHWLYIPEDSLTVHRISEFKNFSEECAPKDKTLICCEITCDYGDEIWNESDENLRKIAVKDLVDIGLIKADEVLEEFTHREVYAYPLYTLGYRTHLDAVLAYLDAIQGLDTTGRQGLFKYNNMDHSVAMGFTAADNIIGGGTSHRHVASGKEYFG